MNNRCNAIQILINFLVVVSFSTSTYCQPSYSVDFTCKFFNKQGQPIDYETFCREYQLLGEGNRNDQTPCTNELISKESFYNDSTNVFSFGGGIIYNNLIRKFVHNKDTMLIILATRGGGHHAFYIDSLIFKPGKYFIIKNRLNKIDFKKAQVNYYNLILKQAIYFKKNFANYKKRASWIELNSLKKKYDISKDDFEEKTVTQIFK